LIFDLMGIYYLKIDHHVCAVSPLWIWSLFALVFQVFFFYLIALCTMIKYSFEYYKIHMTIGAVVITFSIFASGAVILFSNYGGGYTCTNMKNSGLYVWALFAFSVVSIGVSYFLVRTYAEYEALKLGKKKTAESDYLLAQVAVGDRNADPESQVYDLKESQPCGRPSCNEFGTTLCPTCKMICYCSSACLHSHHKTQHKFECAQMLTDNDNSARKPNSSLLGNVRSSSYIPHDAVKAAL
jgi:hypothetical protein